VSALYQDKHLAGNKSRPPFRAEDYEDGANFDWDWVPGRSNLSPTGLLNLAIEPRRLYKPESRQDQPGCFALCHITHDVGDGKKGKMHQDLFDISRLDWVLDQVRRMPKRDLEQNHFYISQATLVPNARFRRISSIMLLNAIWIDIDLAHPPKYFDQALLPAGNHHQADHLAALLRKQIIDAGLPEPTCVIGTGGGLCVKWVFNEAISIRARPRWDSVQRHVLGKVAAIIGDGGSRWPVDSNAIDAPRILRLVGSHNKRWDAPCRMLIDNGPQFDFDYLADEILPYTREEVRNYRSKSAANAAAGKEFDKNRAKAKKVGIWKAGQKIVLPGGDGHDQSVQAQISDEARRVLWDARFAFGDALLSLRGGAQVGQRNNCLWPMALALANSCTSSADLLKEIASLHHSHFKSHGWTLEDSMASAASIIRQRAQGKDKLYRLPNKTFLEKMEVTTSELATLAAEGIVLGSGSGHNANRAKWDHGTMGFKPMSGLAFDVYLAETRRRQALAGPRSAEVRGAPANAIRQDVRAKAVLMRNSGVKQADIAKELGVSQGTVSNWISSK
jgi:hypothetical protein